MKFEKDETIKTNDLGEDGSINDSSLSTKTDWIPLWHVRLCSSIERKETLVSSSSKNVES